MENERLVFLKDKTSKLTASPGIYIMKDKNEKIIYIGKAKNLKNRVISYFRNNSDHTKKVKKMVSQVWDYDFIVTDTEYEALVLECSLIKQHKPKYNILLKDDKGYHYIHITDEKYPRIVAEKQYIEKGKTFGPYTSSFVTKQTVMEVNRVFCLPVCKRKFPQEFNKQRPCLNYYIKQCFGLCLGKTDEKEYSYIIEQAIEYIKKGSKDSIEKMKKEMFEASENLEFEKAAQIRDRIDAILKAADRQKIIDNERDSTDVIAYVENLQYVCVSILMYRGGRLFDKLIYFYNIDYLDEEFLENFIVQYYMNKDEAPKNIFIEKEIENKNDIEELFKNKFKKSVKIFQAKKGENLKLIMLSKNNASEHLSLKVGRTGKELIALEELSKLLGMDKIPSYIEAYDISNLASTSMCAGMVVFENGRPLKKAYKKFMIKSIDIQNDYASMKEILTRRFNRYLDENTEDEGFSRLPDLIFVDGGKGQVNAVLPVLKELSINVPVYGIVKDGKHKTRAISSSGGEISVSSLKSAFSLITKIQDEMHRFAISYQRTLHAKTTYELELTKIKGIGTKKAQKIIMHFKTKEELKKATPDDLAKIAGVNLDIAHELFKFIINL